MEVLKDLFKYYLEHQVELLPKFEGKYLVITKEGVVADFDSEAEAYFHAVAKYGLGNFIIQLCSRGDQDYTQQFTSRAVF